MVQLSWSGQRVPTIADTLGCSAKTVRCWLLHFNWARRSGPCPYWPPPPRLKGPRSSGPRSAESCWPRECAGAVPGPGTAADPDFVP
ncbi:helix-turn-helix domain-containing protein [Streptomyces sp. MNP-20]|uniref:helix-turn-helix domain-containing protein n=1 Tax=Streptomyces sp. MNP-20 TaxID=2721165 RepID=UPI0020A66402|nr:helix-turn-helix domain-containing protein [Streptomyces sp. MNP-20]